MKILMITGDKSFGPGSERYELQRSVVDDLQVVYWGRGSMWPKLPEGHFEVVTAQDPFWRGLFAMWAAKKLGAKLNVQVHTDLSVYGGVKHILMQIVLRHADSVRVVSNKIKQQVERVGVRAKVTVLPVFVDISKFRTVERQTHEGKNVLWVGRFEEEKDPLLALEIIAKIPDAKLLMLGKGSLEQQLRKKAVDLRVVFLGFDDPAKYLPLADVVLSTSRHESWGASIVEALAAGVPVVAPDVGIAGEAGAVVVPRNKLAESVVTVLREGGAGKLLLPMPTREEWAANWKESLQ